MHFLVIGLGVIVCALRMPFFTKVSGEHTELSPAFDAAYLVPAMTLIAISMVTVALSPGFDRFYPVRVILVGIAFAGYRRYYRLPVDSAWKADVGFISCFVDPVRLASRPLVRWDACRDGLRLGLPSARQAHRRSCSPRSVDRFDRRRHGRRRGLVALGVNRIRSRLLLPEVVAGAGAT